MEQEFLKRLEQWHENGEFSKIVEAVESLPWEQRNYELTSQLARALNNIGEYQKASEVLEQIRKEGEKDAAWHYRMGFALYGLGRCREAMACLDQALALDPENTDVKILRFRCEAGLEWDQWDALFDDNETDLPKAAEYMLHCVLHGHLEQPDVIEGDHVRVPSWNLTITPVVESLDSRSMAVVYFYLDCPDWDETIFECSAAMGDTPKNALARSGGSFLFSVMDGISQMQEDGDHIEENMECSSFAGAEHRWKVYKSNILGMGDAPETEHFAVYWDALKEDILSRIGNQKMCYVKIYGAKNGDDITGECRINNLKSEELSRKVEELVSQWNTTGFGSQKQFFFLRQDPRTVLPYPFSKEQIAEKTVQAVKLFHEAQSQEEYDALIEKYREMTGDASLAQELFLFPPELCAENAFQDHLPESEILHFSFGPDRSETIYKTQSASYCTIAKALFHGFESGAFSDWAEDVYRKYILCSSIYHVICKRKEEEGNTDASLSHLLVSYGVDEDYQVR